MTVFFSMTVYLQLEVFTMSYEKMLTKEFFEEQYVRAQKTQLEIASEVGCNDMTIRKYMRKHGISSRPSSPRPTNFTNRRFGKLVVIEDVGRKSEKSRRHSWRCRCDCGNEVVRNAHYLEVGHITSCGCVKRLHAGHMQPRAGKFLKISFWSTLLRSASTRAIDVSISVEQVEKLLFECDFKCQLSGLPLIEDEKFVGSVDRKDNSLGYVMGNVQWLHKDINKMKWAFAESYFIAMCKRVAEMNNEAAEDDGNRIMLRPVLGNEQ